MNLLDENIPLDQRDLLWAWGIHARVVGQDIARLSIADDNIVVLLHRLKQPTIFTRDGDFFNRRLCHPAYGLVFLDVAPEEAALFARRVLRHPRFSTKASRMGIVLRAHRDALHFWQWGAARLQRASWGVHRQPPNSASALENIRPFSIAQGSSPVGSLAHRLRLN